MNPLTAIYGAVSRTRNEFYDRGVLSARRLQGPVVSIGNIAAGGSGKTPFVIALGEMLKRRGVSFDVLSRGYGRKTKGVALVDPDGAAVDFGDEPLLIARRLEVSVVIGEDRYAAGRFAEENFGPRLHLLDDGFQHRGLARDFDIVLVNATDKQDRLFPMGRLREPLSSLARADAIVLTNDAPVEGLPLTHQKVWRVQRDIVAPQLEEPCLAFCGIARPGYFFAQLRATGIMSRPHAPSAIIILTPSPICAFCCRPARRPERRVLSPPRKTRSTWTLIWTNSRLCMSCPSTCRSKMPTPWPRPSGRQLRREIPRLHERI